MHKLGSRETISFGNAVISCSGTRGLYIIAFSTNYLNIRYHLPLGKNRYVIVRILSAVCWLIIILFIIGFMAAIISTALNALIK